MNELDSVRAKESHFVHFFPCSFKPPLSFFSNLGWNLRQRFCFFLVMFVYLKTQCHLILKCYGLIGFKVSLYSVSTLAASILRPEPSLQALNWKGLGGFVWNGAGLGWGRGFFLDPLTFTLPACSLWLFYGLINGGGGFQDKGSVLCLVQLTLWVLTMEGLKSPVCFHRKLFQIDD